MQEVINGDYLAASLNLFTLQKRLKAIRSVMKELWDLHNPVDIPDFQKPENETFDYQLAQYINQKKQEGKFYELSEWALNLERIKPTIP